MGELAHKQSHFMENEEGCGFSRPLKFALHGLKHLNERLSFASLMFKMSLELENLASSEAVPPFFKVTL